MRHGLAIKNFLIALSFAGVGFLLTSCKPTVSRLKCMQGSLLIDSVNSCQAAVSGLVDSHFDGLESHNYTNWSNLSEFVDLQPITIHKRGRNNRFFHAKVIYLTVENGKLKWTEDDTDRKSSGGDKKRQPDRMFVAIKKAVNTEVIYSSTDSLQQLKMQKSNIYKDYMFNLIPYKDFMDWVNDESGGSYRNSPMRCVGSDGGTSLSLGSCQGRYVTFVSVPNTLKGDESNYDTNKFSNIVRLPRKGALFPQLMNFPRHWWNNYDYAEALSGMVERYRDQMQKTPEKITVDITQAFAISNEPNEGSSLNEYIPKLHHIIRGQSPSTIKRDIALRAKADDKGTMNNVTNNQGIVFIDQCSGRMERSTDVSCQSMYRMRTLAETRRQVNGSVIQVIKPKEGRVLKQIGSRFEYRPNEQKETSTQFLIEFDPDANGQYNLALKPLNAAQRPVYVNLNNINKQHVRPYYYYLRDQKLYSTNTIGSGAQMDYDIRYCSSVINLQQGVAWDCHDYRPPWLQRLLDAADIISMIPVIGGIVSWPMYGVVCSSREQAIATEGCFGLMTGVPIDALAIGFDVASFGAISSVIKNAAMKKGVARTLRQIMIKKTASKSLVPDESVLRQVSSDLVDGVTDIPLPRNLGNKTEQAVRGDLNKISKRLNKKFSAYDEQMADDMVERFLKERKRSSKFKLDQRMFDNYIKAFTGKKQVEPKYYELFDAALLRRPDMSPEDFRAIATDIGTEFGAFGAGLYMVVPGLMKPE